MLHRFVAAPPPPRPPLLLLVPSVPASVLWFSWQPTGPLGCNRNSLEPSVQFMCDTHKKPHFGLILSHFAA